MERNRHVDEGTVHAWLDGALGPEEAARVEAHVASCAACGARAAEARGLIAAASRILTALDDVPGDVVRGGRGAGARFSASPERRRRPFSGWPLRAAAAIVFVAVGSFAVVQRLTVTGHPEREAVRAAPQAAPVPAALPPAPPRAADVERKKAAPRVAANSAPALKERAPEASSRGVAGGVAKAAAPQAQSQSAVPAPAPAAAPAAASAPRADSLSAERRMPPARQSALAGAMRSALIHTERPVTLTGRVTATTGEPIASAQVVLSNPRISTATDTVGAYALAVPAREAAGQQAALQVRRLGYQGKTDSVTVAADAAPHDFQLAPATLHLSEVVTTGAASPPMCYTTTTQGLPARIQLADSVHISWSWIGRDSIQVMLNDTTGTQHQIIAHVGPAGLRGQVTDSVGGSVRPFAATRCP